MTDRDLSQLPAAAAVNDGDLLVKWDSTQLSGQRTQRITAAQFKAYLLSSVAAGPAGAMGPATTLYAGSTTTLPAGSQATVSVTGAAPAQYVNIGVPKGDQGIQGIQGVQGQKGDAGATGGPGPTGQQGPPNQLSIRNVTTGAPGSSAAATIQGAPPSQTLDLTIPTGQTGPNGTPAGFASVSATTLDPGTQATATLGGTGPQGYTLAFGIPRGTPGMGNVSSSGTIRSGALALFGDTSGSTIKDGGLPAAVATSGSASDLGAGTLPAARLPALTGDVTTSAGSAATTLAASGVTAGSYGAANTVPVLTVDAKGRITAASTASTGTVTSVALAVPSRQTVTGSPVTGSGTLTIADAAQSAATVFAGPSSGGSAAPTFRALASVDMPAFTGDVTTSAGSTATAIQPAAVTNAKLANAPATTIKGNASGSAAAPSDLSPSQAKTLLGFASSGANTDITSLASPALGAATATTQPASDNSTKVATTAQVAAAIAAAPSGGGAPSATIATTSGTNVTAAAADKGKTYVLVGSATLSLPAAVQVSGWYAWVQKVDGTGVWTIAPASVTIDGRASISMYTEGSYLIWWDNASSVFRTIGRPRGWINVGTTTVSSAVASLSSTIGFGDAELRDMEFDVDGFTPSAADVLTVTVQKGGAYQTSGYASVSLKAASGTVSSATNASSFALQYGTASTTGASFATFRLSAFASSANQWFSGNHFSPGNTTQTQSSGVQNGTSGAITGASVQYGGGSTIATGGVLTQKGYRP